MFRSKTVSSTATRRRDAEKADALASTQVLSLLINTALAISAAAILFRQRHDSLIAPWLAAALVVNVLRCFVLCWRPLRAKLELSPRVRLRLAAAGSLLAGFVWGVLPAYLMNYRTVEAPFVSIILCGLTAGAALQGGAYALPAIALSIPILVPMGIRSALLGTSSGYLLSFDILLYLAMVIRSSRAAETAFDRLVALRLHASSLAVDLQQRHEEAVSSAEQLLRLANHDPLTGAANRAAFTKRLETWLDASRARGRNLTLVLLDLDHFKEINDTLGHGAGDEVLTVIAERLESFSGPDRFVARLGGDEFAMLLADCCESAAETEIAQAIIDRIGAPFLVSGEAVALGASLGLARYPEDAASPSDLLARADLALYAAKAAGRQGWRRFEPSFLSSIERARDIENDLSAALLGGRVEVWFQPQAEILSGNVCGLEALLRWRHPQLGWINPPEIVAAAAKLRCSEALTQLVLESACAAVSGLDAAGLPKARVGVNVSPREVEQFDLVRLITRSLERCGTAANRIEIEITEQAVLGGDGAVEKLAALRANGVRLAVDDFGTGASAITYLRKLTVDRLKLHQSFIENVVASAGDRALTKAIISMGRSLGVEVLAEGVETVEQALVLRSLGCHLAQGFLYGPAQPLEQLFAGLAAAGEPAGAPRRHAAQPTPRKRNKQA